MKSEIRNFLKLYLTKGIGYKFLNEFYSTLGTFEGNLEELLKEFAGLKKLRKEKLKPLLAKVKETAPLLEEILKLLNLYGVEVIPFYDNRFPKELNKLQPAAALFVYGTFNNSKGFAIVGTRRATKEGKEKSFQFASEMAKENFLIVSGGAYGVDRSAHEGALSVNGKTALVLGGGIFRFLQKEKKFAETIRDFGGFVVSQFHPFMEPSKWSFPQRNALIAVLSSYGVLVVEAPSKSGALITAEYALRLGKKLYSYLGCTYNPNYKGNIELISSCRAKLVVDPKELLKELSTSKEAKIEEPPTGAKKDINTSEENRLLKLLKERPRNFDELLALTGISQMELTSQLTELELEGKITQEGGFFKVL